VADGGHNLTFMTPHADPLVHALFEAARAVQAHAYAPYSKFFVGAAVRTSSGAVFSGANMENAAYPEGVCAEGGALSAMVSAGEREIVEVLVIGPEGDRLTTPCGGCRQKLREFAHLDTPVHVAGPEGVRRTFTLGELLPESFGPAHLGI
jgi:cytidine deaminase